MFACTETQYVPALNATADGIGITNEPAESVRDRFVLVATCEPGRPDALRRSSRWRWLPDRRRCSRHRAASTWLMFQVCPEGTTKSSASSLSYWSNELSKFCDEVAFEPALSYWSYSTTDGEAGLAGR